MDEKQTLLINAQQGDITAFHQLFAEFQEPLRSYLYRLTANRGDAEDLTHDAFVRAFDKLTTFQSKSTLKTWVFTRATNLAMNLLQKRKRWPVDAQDQSKRASVSSPEIFQTYLYLNQYSPNGTYEMREHIDFCFTCIAKTLPIEQQIVLLLKDVYEFRIKEIVAIMDKSMGSVQHLLHNARKTMHAIFDQRCALINKQGVCYQCTELNGIFNPKQEAQAALAEIELVQAAEDEKEDLFELRTKLVRSIDPLNAEGADLHDFIMQRIRKVVGEVTEPK
ncbi:MAG: sigma-70 family RNA polymerase sigma factor [Chloroflexota bacterium]